MKLFSRLIATVLAVTVLFAMVPAEVSRADSDRVDITLDTWYVRNVLCGTYSYDYYADRTVNQLGALSTTDEADDCISVVAGGKTLACRQVEYLFGSDGNPDNRYLHLYYAFDDLRFFNAGESVNATINGVPLRFIGNNDICYAYAPDGIAGVNVTFHNNTNYGVVLRFDPSFFDTIEMYRLYNPNSGEHFYTSDWNERWMLIDLGWNDEGIGWIAPNMTNVSVYRLYNQYGGEHHYTTSIAERDALVAAGWNDEGIGWYSYEGVGWYMDEARTYPMEQYTTNNFERAVYLSAGWRDGGDGCLYGDVTTVPLYRQYNPNEFANNHNYTTSLAENNWLVSLGWRAEGTGWYAVDYGYQT
ncbi:MAG: hypothetical protein IKP14_04200 [Clostridiales bacterium]|nr:hypothetical protein [Clostridiales bacterium]